MASNGNGKIPTIGNRGDESSYPDKTLAGRIGESRFNLGMGDHNLNAANFPCEPEVFNESPSTKKSYAWNKGETGNAT
jgi:hypothetical protein